MNPYMMYENGVAILVTSKSKSVILYKKSPLVDGRVVYRKENSCVRDKNEPIVPTVGTYTKTNLKGDG